MMLHSFAGRASVGGDVEGGLDAVGLASLGQLHPVRVHHQPLTDGDQRQASVEGLLGLHRRPDLASGDQGNATIDVSGDPFGDRRAVVSVHGSGVQNAGQGCMDEIRIGAIGMGSFMRMYGDQCERALAAMTSGEQAELRQQIITTCAEALRDCPDTDTRADAYDVLVKLGVFPC